MLRRRLRRLEALAPRLRDEASASPQPERNSVYPLFNGSEGEGAQRADEV